jgi:FkbM family methyltransferase
MPEPLINTVKTGLRRMLPARVEQELRRLILRRHIDAFPKRVVEHRYLDFPLKISIQDEVGQEWYDTLYSSDRLPEIEFLQRGQLKAGAKVFDLGAHQGVVGMVLTRLVGDSGLVVAVEGTQHNANVAMENCRLNGIANMVVLRAVAAEAAGLKMSFSETLNGMVGDTLMPVEVTSVSIDSLAVEYGLPQVVFVDVEGYECQVLDGGQKALAGGADFFVEVHLGAGLERHGSVEKVLSYFPTDRFDLFCSPEEPLAFRPVTDLASLPKVRFFLIAFAKK